VPHLPAIVRVPQLATLASELAHARPQVLLDDARRCEELGLLLRPEQDYPLGWIIERITGFATQHARSDLAGTLHGADVLSDLGALCERLCQRVIDQAATGDAEAARAIALFAREPNETLVQLRKRLGISSATTGRLRRAGLVTRRVPGPRNVPCVCVCTAHATQASALLPRKSSKRAQHSQRMSEREATLYVRAATRYRKWARLSLHAVAERLGAWTARSGRAPRSVEGLRALLQRDPRTKQLFPRRFRPSTKRVLACVVLVRAGAEPAELAKRLGRSTQLVRRDMLLCKRELLRAWLAEHEPIAGPAFQLPRARETLLAPVRRVVLPTSLDGKTDDAAVAQLRSELPLPVARERELAIAMHFLHWQARGLIPGVSHLHPSAHDIDTIETCLRGAWLLGCVLAASQRRRVLETLEVRCNQSYSELVRSVHPARVRRLLRVASDALHEGVRGFDPFKGGRLAASCSLRIDRALARALREQELGALTISTHLAQQGKRATAMVPTADGTQSALTRALPVLALAARRASAGFVALPPARVLHGVGTGLNEHEASVLRMRWLMPHNDGSRELPCTLRELGQRLGLDDMRAFALQQRALRAVMRR
jgi:hypothetical protein